jgi:putative tryptophan/tyrosine transport system substrate-binding protein
MQRRDFVTLLGLSAVGWPLPGRAQQPRMPVVGLLASFTSSLTERIAPELRHGLNEAGYIEGQNVLIEYRSAEGRYDRLPALATDLVERGVVLIFAVGGMGPSTIAKTRKIGRASVYRALTN